MAVSLAEPTVLAAAKGTLYPQYRYEFGPVCSYRNIVHTIHPGRVEHLPGTSRQAHTVQYDLTRRRRTRPSWCRDATYGGAER
jgi:hypothetical protein